MARQLRIEGENLWYHVYNRGNEKRNIFLTDTDRVKFLDSVFGKAMELSVEIHAYSLMLNHFHLYLMTRYANLSRFMHDSQSEFTTWYNRAYERAGHVYGGRYKAIVVESEGYGRELGRYIDLNHPRSIAGPGVTLRDQLRDLRDYPWSSYRAHVGLEQCPWPLRTDGVLAGFGEDLEQQQQKYARFVKEGLLDFTDPFESVYAQCILGSEEFIERIKRRVAQKADKGDSNAEFTRRYLMAHELEEIIEVVCDVCAVKSTSIMPCRVGAAFRDARHVLLWAAAKWCRPRLSVRQIGESLGGVTHAAVWKSRQKVENLLQTDATVARQVSEILRRLGSDGGNGR
jgi:REP element-mobilizing transposase RayT